MFLFKLCIHLKEVATKKKISSSLYYIITYDGSKSKILTNSTKIFFFLILDLTSYLEEKKITHNSHLNF